MSDLLVASGVTKRFGGVHALSEVSFTIRRGEIYGLIGPNGAGKTTLFNVLTGLYASGGGRIDFCGTRIDRLKPHQVAASGIARTFQNIRLFGNLSALENVMVGRHVRTRAGVLGAVLRDRSTREEEAAIQARAIELLAYVGIAGRANDAASSLPYGDQRRLEIARSLATDPTLLALDEPAVAEHAASGEEFVGRGPVFQPVFLRHGHGQHGGLHPHRRRPTPLPPGALRRLPDGAVGQELRLPESIESSSFLRKRTKKL